MGLTPNDADMTVGDELKPSPSEPGKPFDASAQADRIKAAMSRPGPSVRVEDLDLTQNPFASHVPLTAPSKYRCAMLHVHVSLALIHSSVHVALCILLCAQQCFATIYAT
jgi:hypothetical protein